MWAGEQNFWTVSLLGTGEQIVRCSFLVIVDLSVIGQESNSMTDSIPVNHEMCHPILFPDWKISPFNFYLSVFQFLHNLCSISL